MLSVSDPCPRCSCALVTVDAAIPWGGGCEWNLDAFDRPTRSVTGLRWLDRWSHKVAFRLDRAQYAELAARPPGSAGASVARAVLMVVSLALFAATLALVWLGVLLVGYHFPDVTVLPGLLLIGLALALRPRLGRFTETYDTVTREDAPTLFALIDRVAVQIGAKPPTVIVGDADFNAGAGVFGLRRRRVLWLGLPLWGALDPQERVALLGHELGHFVNGDPLRGLLTQPAVRTFGELARIFSPNHYLPHRAAERVAMLLIRPLLWLVSRTAVLCQLVLLWVAMRDHQRAEYAADFAAARAAGTDAAVRMLDVLVLTTAVTVAVRTAEREARALRREHAGVTAWRAAANSARRARTDRLPLLRQRSIRAGADLLSTHPPAGLRSRMVAAWPAEAAAVTLTNAESTSIDTELTKRYDRAGRTFIDLP
jgi:Zn-dependent protease with chaperone function